MRNRTVKHKNISRVDHEPSRTHGYSVRVQWKGQRRAKFFADGKYGDRLAAFFAALDWRNMVEKELGKPRTERQVLGVTHSPSGITGVRRRREGDTEYYEATWATSAGKQARTKYSIARHGEKRALQLAKQARKRGEQERLRTPARSDD
ncbi:MAG TPA: AP2 domain-containing protein [Herpetosiphonaceae bacterium]